GSKEGNLFGENRRTRSRPKTLPLSESRPRRSNLEVHCRYYLEKKEGFITRKERKILVRNEARNR
ncbi:unnamed protein product, partial [Brassica rapa]